MSVTMFRFLLFLVLAASCLQQGAAQSASKATAFVNGLWFTGKNFQRGTFYALEGVLTRRKPSAEIETMDLGGGFVVPPFADAHNHFPDSEQTFEWANRSFLESGVFYVLNANDIAERSNAIRRRLATADTVDVIFAHGGFTSPTGHPKALYERLVDQKVYAYPKPDLEGRAFYSIGSMADIDKKWPSFLETKPDFVKVYFLYSELYRLSDGKRKSGGLRPEFVAEIVRRARAVHLRTGAHVEDAGDYHNVIEVGVDFALHLPGYSVEGSHNGQEYILADSDIKDTAKRGVFVVTTAALLDPKKNESLRQVQIRNLRRLKDARAKILVGSDTGPGGGVLREIEYLKDTGVFTNLDLLRMWCETTPAAIFPARKIGKLCSGYEASFLVLSKDPLQDLSAVKQIKVRVKRGKILKLPPAAQP